MHLYVTSTLTLLQCSRTAYAIRSKLLTSEIELLGKKVFFNNCFSGRVLSVKHVFKEQLGE